MSQLSRHHVIWGAGVRLFRNLSFVGKAALISAAFLLVVAQLSVVFVRATGESIAAARSEQQGIVHVRAIVELLAQAQELRRLALAGGGKPDAALQQQLQRVQAGLAALDRLDAGGMDLAEAQKFVKEAFTPLTQPAGDREDAFNRADDFVQQLMRLMTTVADRSSLSLDPDAGSYHLMMAVTHDTVDVQRRLGRLRDLGSDALAAGGELPPLHARILAGDSYVLYGALEELFGRYERAVAAEPELAARLDFQEALKPVNTLLRATRKGLLGREGATGDAAAYAAAGQAATASIAALNQRSAEALDGLIGRRVEQLQRTRNLQLMLAAAILLVAAYGFVCFYLATRSGMEEVTLHIDAMARGDLSTDPVPTGRDEAAALMASIRHMQGSMRQLIGEVRGCAEEIVATSAEVASGAEDLSQRTEKSAGSLQQTASAMEQIAATVQNTAQRADQSAALGRENARVAGEGGEVIAQVVSTMHEIRSSSTRIADITGVIDGIAFQTNILALNAAVEAARAGEHGRGFAVVASEVRALAQRSGQAAREIRSLVTASAERTAEGERIVGQAGETMSRLVANAQSMSTLLAEVSAASGEQTRGVGEVGRAVADLDQDTQRNSALVEQTNAAATTMKQRAEELARTAERFTLERAPA